MANNTDWIENISIRTIPCDNPSSECLKYEIVFDTVVSYNNVTRRSFRYFLAFGDGDYTTGVASIPLGQTSDTIYIEHNYRLAGNMDAVFEAAIIYDDDKEPSRIIINPNIGTVPPESPPPPSNDTVIINHYLKPRAGDTITYTFSFLPDCNNDFLTDNLFEISFDTLVAEIVNVHTPGFNGQDLIDINDANDQSKLEIPYRLDFRNNRMINCFVQFLFKDTLQAEDQVFFNAQLKPDPNTTVPKCTSFPLPTDLSLSSVESHDPNEIITIDSICPNHMMPDSITYDIIFQNVGKGPARTIIVYDELPVNLDINSVRVISPAGIQNSSEHFFVDINERMIQWILDTIYIKNNVPSLKGKLLGKADPIVNENDTRDTIRFRVKIDRNIPLTPCGAIVNQAKIIFDSNIPILTNVFRTSITCDTFCTSCNITIPKNHKKKLKIQNGTSISLDLPATNINNKTIIWHPTSYLDVSNLNTAVFTPDTAGVYFCTAVVTDNCDTKHYSFEIHVAKKQTDCKWYCCPFWVIPILLIVVIILFIVKRIKKNNSI